MSAGVPSVQLDLEVVIQKASTRLEPSEYVRRLVEWVEEHRDLDDPRLHRLIAELAPSVCDKSGKPLPEDDAIMELNMIGEVALKLVQLGDGPTEARRSGAA